LAGRGGGGGGRVKRGPGELTKSCDAWRCAPRSFSRLLTVGKSAGGGGVNDMYTQTGGRTGGSRKEGKTPWKTKPSGGGGEEGGRGEGTRLKCLGSSDDSQSSCLLASPFSLRPPPSPCSVPVVRPPARPLPSSRVSSVSFVLGARTDAERALF